MTDSRGGAFAPPPSSDVGPSVADSIQVDVDGDGRVVGVRIAALPEALRVPLRLAAAFRAALAHALAAALPAATGVRDADGKVRATRVTSPGHRPFRQLVEEALARPPAGGPVDPGPLPGHERGVSDNDCVTVVLDVSGPGGDLLADAGWLSQATSANVAAAITQAFTAAYRERGAR